MMSERFQHPSGVRYSYRSTARMENDFSPRKTKIVLVIVVGCFAVLWPSVFYPMLLGSPDHIQPSEIDKRTGCCYVLSEKDVDAIKIMSELCGNIIKSRLGEVSLTAKQITNICQDEVLKTCGIDISAVLQEQVRLGKTTKDILDQVRSLNGSLCLKYNFGVAPWRLGVPHIITLRNTSDMDIRQERALRSEIVHPAMLEKGSAISQKDPSQREPKIIIDGKPPMPAMRPPLGAGAHGIRHQEPRTMGIVMPIYTVGIIIFFTYTIMKIIFRKHPDTDNIIYSTIDGQDRYRKDTFRDNSSRNSGSSCTLGWKEKDARDVELDQLRRRLRETEMAMERVVTQMAKLPLKSQDDPSTTSNMSNGSIKKDEKPSVKVMAMETSESCEGGKKWQSVNSSVLPNVPSLVNDQVSPPQEIFLDRTLPPQSQILVADSATETEKNSGDDPAVVLAGKMTLSVISLENENLEIQETENVKGNETNDKEILEISKQMLENEIVDLIEEAVENLEISKLDVIAAKDIKGDAADNESVTETVEINEQIAEEVDNISKLLGDKDHNSVELERTVEDEKLRDEEIAVIAAEKTSPTIEEQEKISNPELSNDIPPIDGSNIIEKKDITNLIGENLLIEDSREDAKSNENQIVASSSEKLSHESSNGHSTSPKLPDIKPPDVSKESANEVTKPKIVSALSSNGNRAPIKPEEKVTEDSQNIYDHSAIEVSKPVEIICEKPSREEYNISHTSLLNAKSSSEESGSTAQTTSNPGSVINVGTKYETKTEEELDVSEEEESDVESEEEIEISEEEEEIEENEINRDSSEVNEGFNAEGNALLINGNDQNHEKEESDEDEEEIIEEYSEEEEEEEEVEDDEDTNDGTHISSNGNRDE